MIIDESLFCSLEILRPLKIKEGKPIVGRALTPPKIREEYKSNSQIDKPLKDFDE